MATTVRDYQTGERLSGAASERLVRESAAAAPTGAVRAYCDEADVWHWVDESDARGTRTVYVEA